MDLTEELKEKTPLRVFFGFCFFHACVHVCAATARRRLFLLLGCPLAAIPAHLCVGG
jgi:hypothetical protein